MINQRGVIVTDNAYDYAVAISLHRELARMNDLSGCYPVQLPAKSSAALQPLFTYYGLKVIDFSTLFPESDVAERSSAAARGFSANGQAIRLATGAEPEAVARAVRACLQQELPLCWTELETAVEDTSLQAPSNGARQAHLLLIRKGSPLALAAMFYGHIARKHVQFVDSLEECLKPGVWRDAESVILVDEFAAFNKHFLARVAAGQPTARGTKSPAILTAYSPAAFTGLVWRMLEHRAFRENGFHSHLVEPGELLGPAVSHPVEYSVISEHGNESHMHYGHDVLCGAISSDFRTEEKRSFNCEWSCPHEPRRSAAQLPVHHLAILSCNTFTLGDGVVTPDFSLLLNFLNGWPISIIAAFQHAVSPPIAAVLLDALIQSGLNLGEVARRLNTVSIVGSYRDPVYVLVGDPEMVVATRTRAATSATVAPSSNGIEIAFSGMDGRVAECTLPENAITDMLAQGRRPGVSSVSGPVEAGVYFCFTNQQGAIPDGLLIFADHDVHHGPWTLRIEPTPKANEEERASGLEFAARLRQQRIFGVDPTLLSRMEDAVVSAIRSRSNYPGYSESLWREHDNEHTLAERLLRIRRALLSDLVRRTKDRVWLNHHYVDHYPTATHLPPDPSIEKCDFCSNQTERWRYQDNCSGLPSRDMTICPRCGIVRDCPAKAEIEIRLQPASAIEGTSHRQHVTIVNHSQTAINLSYFVQFHSWKKLGVDGDTPIFDALIPPKGSVNNVVDFHFARPLPDYIHDVMAYVLTENLDLYNVGQRVTSRQRGMFVARLEPFTQHGDAHHHHPQHHGHPQHDQSHDPHHNSPNVSTTAPMGTQQNGTKRPMVIVEPHAALFRYLHIARRRFHVVVLTTRPDRCLQRERYFSRSMGLPTGTQLDRLIQCDTTSVQAMYEALAPWKDKIAGVLAGDDVFVPGAAELGRRFDFDYALPEDGTAQHLKTAMKRRFREKGVPTPRFVIATTLEEAKDGWEQLGRDCMVKMVDFEASMNIFRVASLPELEAAWDTIVNNRNNLKVPFRLSQEVILEEFVTGRELTIEGYVQNDRCVCLNFCEKITDNFIVVGHLIPAQVSQKEAACLQRVAEQCVSAVGMRNTVFHVEVHLRGDDPYVIECAARPPGANMVELMQRTYSFDLMEIGLSLAAGESVQEAARVPKVYFAMLALYSKESGTLSRVEGWEELHRRGGVVHTHLDVKPGDRIEPLAGMHQGDGFIMLEDLTADGVREKARWMREHVHLVLREQLEEAVA